ncbi:MAG: hypothetical protein K6B68_13405 [Eubacterium sp.]|nr:hypothetical protein [Eubacterium sp.]
MSLDGRNVEGYPDPTAETAIKNACNGMDKKVICINGVPVTAVKDIVEFKMAAVEMHAGTTGLCGCEHKEDGRTYISIKNAGKTDMRVTPIIGKDGSEAGFEIEASGDDSLVALIYAFASVASKLIKITTGEAEE